MYEWTTFLVQMQHVAFSPIAIMGVCVCVRVRTRARVCVRVHARVCVCVSLCLYASLLDHRKMVIDRFATFSPPSKSSNDVFSDPVAHDLDLIFESQRLGSRPFW